MKLKATYVKLSVGRIMATITVIDQVEIIRNKLNRWRNAKVPDEQVYSI